jgi:Holliday junction resolvase RusA-like endonuclease
MLSYTVSGNPIVKKNTQKVVWRNGRSIVVYSPQYRGWLNNAMDELALQKRPAEPIDYPVLLVCKFFMQTLRVVDLSALYEGIQDTLVKMEILKDDNFNIIIGHDGSRVLLDRNNPRTEVAIVPADHSPAGKN